MIWGCFLEKNLYPPPIQLRTGELVCYTLLGSKFGWASNTILQWHCNNSIDFCWNNKIYSEIESHELQRGKNELLFSFWCKWYIYMKMSKDKLIYWQKVNNHSINRYYLQNSLEAPWKSRTKQDKWSENRTKAGQVAWRNKKTLHLHSNLMRQQLHRSKSNTMIM